MFPYWVRDGFFWVAVEHVDKIENVDLMRKCIPERMDQGSILRSKDFRWVTQRNMVINSIETEQDCHGCQSKSCFQGGSWCISQFGRLAEIRSGD